jgi:hypothetical protein
LPKTTQPTARRTTRPSVSAATMVRGGRDATNAVGARQKRAPRLPRGIVDRRPNGDVDPVKRLGLLTTAYETAGRPKGRAEEELARFLAELSDDDERAIRKWWAKLPKGEQDRHLEMFNGLDGACGPAAKLMEGIYEDGEALLDRVPTPPPALDPKWVEEQTAAILRTCLPEDKAREIAAGSCSSEEDFIREALREEAIAMYGDTPEAARIAEGALAKYRRQGKWIAVCDAVEPAESRAKAHAREGELRAAVPEIARLADKAVQDLPALLVAPANATVVRDQVLLPLFRTVDDAGLVADAVPAAAWLVDCIARGEPWTADDVAVAARALAAVADEARALGQRLKRAKKRPPKPAVDAAVSLHGLGLKDWQAITTLLDRKGLRLCPDPHTPANLRRAVRNRIRRPPADKK